MYFQRNLKANNANFFKANEWCELYIDTEVTANKRHAVNEAWSKQGYDNDTNSSSTCFSKEFKTVIKIIIRVSSRDSESFGMWVGVEQACDKLQLWYKTQLEIDAKYIQIDLNSFLRMYLQSTSVVNLSTFSFPSMKILEFLLVVLKPDLLTSQFSQYNSSSN